MEYCFFFFKQKTAYEISACLVGSEMCIRDSDPYDNQVGEATVGERSVDAGSYVRSVELLGMEELTWEDNAV